MKDSLSSIPTQRIARSLLLILATTAACTFFSACVGHQARVENRVEPRQDGAWRNKTPEQKAKEHPDEQILKTERL